MGSVVSVIFLLSARVATGKWISDVAVCFRFIGC